MELVLNEEVEHSDKQEKLVKKFVKDFADNEIFHRGQIKGYVNLAQHFKSAESEKTNKNSGEESQSINSQLFLIEGGDMKGITKRNDGRYMIRKVIAGERITKYARTIAEAKIILQKMNTGKIQPKKVEKIKNYTLEQYSSEYLELYKKPFLTARSYCDVKLFVQRFVKELGKYKLKDVSTTQIQSFFNKIPKSRSKEKIYTYFKAIMQKAVDTNLIDKNPFNAVIKEKKLKCKNNAFTFAEQEQILRLAKGTDIEHEIMIYLMCGCRPNELPGKKDFDFKNNLITIHGTKNENAKHRVVEMSFEFADYIKKYLSKSEVHDEKYVSTKFISLCKTVNISKPLLYRLRHTFATNHFTLGTQPKVVQQWLGHSSISMTLDQYTDIDKTATKDKIIALYNNFYYIKK